MTQPNYQQMSAAIVITTHRCRYCRVAMPESVATFFGSEAAGFMCTQCFLDESAAIEQLVRELEASNTIELDAPGLPLPCAICGAKYTPQQVVVHLEGRIAMICLKCEPKYVEKHKYQVGPKRFNQG